MKAVFSSLSPGPRPADSSILRGLRLLPFFCLCLAAGVAYAESSTSSVKFKDPSQPGRLKIFLSRGDLKVTESDAQGEVRVTSDAKQEKAEARSDGLRVLSDPAASFSLTAEGNAAELSYGKPGPGFDGSGADFDVTVPRNTSIEIQYSLGGDIVIEKLTGDIVIKGLNCEVKLKEVAGSVSVETVNGDIDATFASLPNDKPVSFSSLNGDVVVRVPSDSKAKVRFRTHHGTILTDFPAEVLKTTSENLGNGGWGVYARENVKLASQYAASIGSEIAEATREMKAALREAQKEAERAQKEAEAEQAEQEKAEAKVADKPSTGTKIAAPKPPKAPRPPRPPSIPAISGGKAVSGDLNGGGSEVLVTTMGGDITFRMKKG